MTVIDQFSACLKHCMMVLSPIAVHFCLQLDAIVLVPIVFCGGGYFVTLQLAAAAMRSPSPNIPIQVLLCVSGWIVALLLPVSRVNIEEPSARIWLMTITIFVLIVGVRIQTYLLGLPTDQRKSATWSFYTVITFLCLFQFFHGDWHQ